MSARSVMSPPYDAPARLARLSDRAARPGTQPRLIVMTDPDRTPDPVALAHRTPQGSWFIYRHFGAADRHDLAATLAETCRSRGLGFLVSGDPELAIRSGADGVHWPERMITTAARQRLRLGNMIFTGAIHSRAALRRADRAGLDAVLLSPVFPSASPSARHPLGAMRTRLLLQDTTLPVYLLGGMNAQTIKRLAGAGAAGFAMIGAML